MNHLTENQFKKYMDNELNEQEQNVVESHICLCDTCMHAYLAMLDNYPFKGTLSEAFTNQTVSKIYDNTSSQKQLSRQTPAKKVLIHYFLAAGLTILLMITGVFQSVLDFTDTKNLEDKPSITNQMMKETEHLLDQIKGEYNQ